jgi:toxin ParE1/3/4
MKVVALRFSLQAEEDLIEIWNYAAQYESRAADRLLRELKTRLKLLSEYPLAGPIREDMPDGIRHLVIGKYIAFYRVTEDAVVIARVLHGRRDITAEDMR